MKMRTFVSTLDRQARRIVTVKLTFAPMALWLLMAAIFWPLAAMSQNNIKYFGYAYGAEDSTDLSKTGFYTNFASTDGVYGQSLVARVNAMTAANVLALIDLGQVLWCQTNGQGNYHLCSASDQGLDYRARWNAWKSQNQSVLNTRQVLAFGIIDAAVAYGIPDQDVNAAAQLVKGDFPAIITYSTDGAIHASQFRNSPYLDWLGLDQYGIDPLTDSTFKNAIATLKRSMYSNQKLIYVLDAFWEKDLHRDQYGLCQADLGPIAYEWYRAANADPQAVMLVGFLWPSIGDCSGRSCSKIKCTDACPSDGCPLIGSVDLPQSVRDAQIAIGRTILGKSQGYLDGANCQQIWGWAWYSDQPNTPINVDIYDGNTLLATVAANLFRQDLLNAGKGNGYHAFSYNVPNSLRDNKLHSISDNYGGTQFTLSNTPRSITCPVPTASISWILPAEQSWGPPGTLTAAGYALNGSGGVQLVWRDATVNGNWNTVAYQPTPSPNDGSWSNTIPAPIYHCDTYQAYVNYSGVRSSTFSYNASYLFANQSIYSNHSILSCDGRFKLILQPDGNLVLYEGNTALWASNTGGKGGTVATLQGDGNFVIYDAKGKPVWASNTPNHPGADLLVQNDGNVVIYYNNAPIWATNTCCH